MPKRTVRVIVLLIAIPIVLCLCIQLIPVWLAQNNPPVLAEPRWDSPQTRALAKRACFDCHSNETYWPWYSNVAPVSWLVQRDVDEGRRHLNFSEWGAGRHEVGEVGETIREGEMPPPYYVLIQSRAKLSVQERDALVNGLLASIGASGIEGESD